MECPQCGASLAQGARFCHQCGTQLGTPSNRERKNEPADQAGEICWQGRFSKRAMVGWWLLATGVTIGAILLASLAQIPDQARLIILSVCALGWFLLVVRYFYLRFSTKYLLTPQYLSHQTGLLWQVTNRIETIDIDDVAYEQGPIERLMGVGTIRVLSSDQSHPELLLPGIEHVRQVADTIDDFRRAERERRGLHIESI